LAHPDLRGDAFGSFGGRDGHLLEVKAHGGRVLVPRRGRRRRVARIILRRPPLNVLHLDMVRELVRALDGLRPEGARRALVIAAAGKAFSAGVAVEDHLPPQVHAVLPAFHDVFRKLHSLGVPTIAAVQGAAKGGGCELACFADWVVASEDASFGLPEVKLGSFPPVAAVHFPHRIGRARTLQMILSGETLPATEALRIGLVDRVVPAARLGEAVEARVDELRAMSGPVLRLARRAVVDDVRFDEELRQVERLFLGELMTAEDAVEGLRAFLEKRPPIWRHQ
jgi:cyclohexa-1,5-dienecarbonyl-CoA hydratase